MTAFTGSENFPGGLSEWTVSQADSLKVDLPARNEDAGACSGRRITTPPTRPASRDSSAGSTFPPTTSTAARSARRAARRPGSSRGATCDGAATGVNPDPIGVAMLGYAFMGQAHSRALQALRHLDVPLRPELVSISGRNRGRGRGGARALGVGRGGRRTGASRSPTTASSSSTTAARTRSTPSRAIEAARNGKHVLCEKPLGLHGRGVARGCGSAAEQAGVVHMCGFNYRFVPAVRLRAGAAARPATLGDVVHFRARYLQSWGWEADESVWRFDRARRRAPARSATSARHIIDLARYLVGEIAAVSAVVRTSSPGRQVDDHLRRPSCEFENGVAGTLEASRLARGRINSERVRGQRVEGLGRLRRRAAERAAGRGRARVSARARHRAGASVHALLVAARAHRRLGRHVHRTSCAHMLEAIAGEHGSRRTERRSRTATAATRSCDAILRSAESGKRRGGAFALKTSLGIWALGPMVTRFVPAGYQPQWAGESTVERVRRAVDGLGDLIDGYEFHYPQRARRGRTWTRSGKPSAGTTSTRRERAPPRPALRPRRPRLARPGHPRGGAPADRGRCGLRRLDRRALHHLAGDRGLQLPVPDAVSPRAGQWLIEGIGEAARALPPTHGVLLFLEHKNSEPAMKILMRKSA